MDTFDKVYNVVMLVMFLIATAALALTVCDYVDACRRAAASEEDSEVFWETCQ